jgi:small-conductance mechanosensitive channel
MEEKASQVLDEKQLKFMDWWESMAWSDLAGVVLILLLTPALIWGYARVVRWLADEYPRLRLALLVSVPVMRVVIWVFALSVAIFVMLDPPQKVVIAVGASAALAIGLALQDVLKSIVAGIVMLFQRPFSVGDMVELSGHYGEVIGTGLISVRLRTFNDSTVTLLNSKVFTDASVNSNSASLQELVPINLTVFGMVDSAQVRAICEQALACSPYVTLGRPIIVVTEDVGEYHQQTTRFILKAYVNDVRCERLMATDVLVRAHRDLRAAGVLVAGSDTGLAHVGLRPV